MMNGIPASLLFACSENSVRSPMAEALVDFFAAAALDELGIDVHRHHAKTFDDVDPSSFDLIVTLSPEAHHQALEFTRGTAAEVEYWPVMDPSGIEGSREMRLEAYRSTRDQILARLKARFGAPSGPSV
jgi:protein-tyrosine-phosphatase